MSESAAESVRAMYLACAGDVHVYVTRRVGGDLADDIVAETFRRAIESFDHFDPGAKGLAEAVADHLAITDVESMPPVLPIDTADHPQVDVLVLIGRELANRPARARATILDETSLDTQISSVSEDSRGWSL